MFKRNSIAQFIFSWMALIAIVTGTIQDSDAFQKAEFEDSIELEKEIEDGEKEMEAFLFHSHQLEQIDFELKVVSTIQFCQMSTTTRAPEKLYLLFQQLRFDLV
ncbi:MAG: hypothetical protein RIM99_08495 [Cyclobacteriaceae bacterium]